MMFRWCIQKYQKFFNFVFLKISPSENHENTTFRAFLETEGPRDRACGKERKILFRIALTRALYDQMAPQLYRFYVPGKLRSFSRFFLRFGPGFCKLGRILEGFWRIPGVPGGSLGAPWGVPGGARGSPAPVRHRDPQKVSKVCNCRQKQAPRNSCRHGPLPDFGTTRESLFYPIRTLVYHC